MILTVTPNPAIDRILFAPHFSVNRLHRVEKSMSVPGGKGVNIARIMQILGAEVITMGFIAGNSGRFLEEELRRNNITTNFIYVDGQTRTNYIIVDELRGTQTQINERGPLVPASAVERLKEQFKRALTQTEMVILGGSLPPGVETNLYTELIDIARENNIYVILNATGEPLVKGINAQPSLVKPDIRATNELLGVKLDSNKVRIKAAQMFLEKGVEAVIISFDYINQLVVTKDKVWEAKAKDVEITSRVGTQDCILGATAYSLLKEEPIEKAIQLGIAAGIASATHIENVPKSAEEIESFLEKVVIAEVENES